MKLTWLTDIHLNFLEKPSRLKFYDAIIASQGDAVLITGDIAEAPSVSELMKEMAQHIKRPIYFVLGNHDYYRGNVTDVKQEMTALTNANEYLFWLPASGPIQLTQEIILLGQDGWADGRYGDYANSSVRLNDCRFIADLIQANAMGKYPLLEKMQTLADSDAKALHEHFIESVQQPHPKKIIMLTHIPPYKESCFHEGHITNDDFLPYFACKATGDVITQVAEQNSEIEFLILCGHTHETAFYQPLQNLTVKTGQAQYYQPEIQEVLQIPNR